MDFHSIFRVESTDSPPNRLSDNDEIDLFVRPFENELYLEKGMLILSY